MYILYIVLYLFPQQTLLFLISHYINNGPIVTLELPKSKSMSSMMDEHGFVKMTKSEPWIEDFQGWWYSQGSNTTEIVWETALSSRDRGNRILRALGIGFG